MLYLRSLLFSLCMFISVIPFATLGLLTFPLPFTWRYPILTTWQRLTVFYAKVICGIHYRVEGLEHIKGLKSAVAISNHQSTWETLAFFQIFPHMCFVLKRELLRIPFFGWSLSLLNPIGIDRAAAKKALDQLIKQGKQILEEDRWVVIFPEGHRMPPEKLGDMKPGGIFLAVKSGCPVVPVVHNAGYYWPRRAFIKKPGIITVVIGEPILTEGKSASLVTKEVEAWMQTHYARLMQ